MKHNSGTSLALFALVALATMLCGCSGGDGGGGGGGPVAAPVVAAVTAVDTQTYAADGIICVDFQVTGPVGTLFSLLAQYELSAPTLAAASPIPASLGTTLTPPVTPPSLNGLTVGGTGSFTGRYYWWASSDLGGLSANQLRFAFTPFTNGDPLAPNGVPAYSTNFAFAAPLPMGISAGTGAGQVGSGAPPTATGGRAGHTAHAVRGTTAPGSGANVLITGGYDGNATVGNAFSSADRFAFDLGMFPTVSHTLQSNLFPGNVPQRVLHGAAFYINPTTGLIEVLMTGGVNHKTVEALNPGAPDILARVAGATDSAEVDSYSFSPEGVTGRADMPAARYGHTATWVPELGYVVVIGGVSGTTAGTLSGALDIIYWDPVFNAWNTATGQLPSPRVGHTACVLADGRILIVGGYDPTVNPPAALPPVVFDLRADQAVGGNGPSVHTLTGLLPAAAAALGRTEHTCTRAYGGGILVAGGRDLSGTLLDSALWIVPNATAPATPSFAWNILTMDRARALHSATLLGSGKILIAGGITYDPSAPVEFTTSCQIFDPAMVGTTPFTPISSMSTARAEHSATATDRGSVFVIGGRNDGGIGSNVFLDSIEFFAFSNSVPQILNPMTATTDPNQPSMLAIRFTVADVDQDGGYVMIRYRSQGEVTWHVALVAQQILPGSATPVAATGQVLSGENTFVWNWTANGLSENDIVEIQIIPVGAVIGSPTSFTAQIVP